MNLLHIDSSILGPNSASRELTARIVSEWQLAHPGSTVTYRDLASNPLPHFSPGSLAGSDAVEAARNATVLQEFMAAEVVVVGAPLYNFSIPSQLKTWIDRISVAGKTFRYTEKGPQGLAGGKHVIVAVSRGSLYGADSPLEHGESYLKALFGFLGIEDVTVVRAEGLAYSPQHRAESMGVALAAGAVVARNSTVGLRPAAAHASVLPVAA